MARRATSRGSARIFQLLKADHGDVALVVSKLERARDDEECDRLFAELYVLLTGHGKAEEALIYPRLRRTDIAQDFAEHATEEHAEIKKLLREMDQNKDDGKKWTLALKDLKMTVKDHMKEEESEGFRKMRKVFSEEELETMGRLFETAKTIVSPVQRLVRKRSLIRKRR